MTNPLLDSAWLHRRSLLSVGLEPCPEYLPPTAEFPDTIQGHERALMAIAEAAAPFAAAYKFNLAFFEALGPDGWAMLKRVRDRLPKGLMVIADAKRGDIGSTAKRYAQSTFEWLNADAVTLSPLMGRDSAEPFLAYSDRLCFFLCLTSNPGSKDFLDSGDLCLKIAREVTRWGRPSQIGLVVGATHPRRAADIRAAAPHATFLIPGVGAQGGDARAVAAAAQAGAAHPALLFHATRSLLAGPSDTDPLATVVARKAKEHRDAFADAMSAARQEADHA